MQVTKTNTPALNTPARAMTIEAMQQDFEYEMAEKITKALLDNGLISEDERERISALNREKFTPFYRDIMEK